MFGISGFELLVISVFILLIFGPDKLPEIARTVSRFSREFKAAREAMEGMIRSEMYAAEREERLKNASDWTKAGERTEQWAAGRSAAMTASAAGAASEETPAEDASPTAVADADEEAYAPIAIPLDENGEPVYPAEDEDDGFGEAPEPASVTESAAGDQAAGDGEEARASAR